MDVGGAHGATGRRTRDRRGDGGARARARVRVGRVDRRRRGRRGAARHDGAVPVRHAALRRRPAARARADRGGRGRRGRGRRAQCGGAPRAAGPHRHPRGERARGVRRPAAAPGPFRVAAARHPEPAPRCLRRRPRDDGPQRSSRPPAPRARVPGRARAARASANRRNPVDEHRTRARPRRKPDAPPRRRRHVVPRDPRVRPGRRTPPDPLEVDGEDRSAHGAPVRGVAPIAHGRRAGVVDRRVRGRGRVRARRELRRIAGTAGGARRARGRGRRGHRDPARRAGAPARDPASSRDVEPHAPRRVQRCGDAREHDARRRGGATRGGVERPPLDRVRRGRLDRAAHSPASGRARIRRGDHGGRRHLRRARPPAHASPPRPHGPRRGTLDDLTGLLLQGATS